MMNEDELMQQRVAELSKLRKGAGLDTKGVQQEGGVAIAQEGGEGTSTPVPTAGTVPIVPPLVYQQLPQQSTTTTSNSNSNSSSPRSTRTPREGSGRNTNSSRRSTPRGGVDPPSRSTTTGDRKSTSSSGNGTPRKGGGGRGSISAPAQEATTASASGTGRPTGTTMLARKDTASPLERQTGAEANPASGGSSFATGTTEWEEEGTTATWGGQHDGDVDDEATGGSTNICRMLSPDKLVEYVLSLLQAVEGNVVEQLVGPPDVAVPMRQLIPDDFDDNVDETKRSQEEGEHRGRNGEPIQRPVGLEVGQLCQPEELLLCGVGAAFQQSLQTILTLVQQRMHILHEIASIAVTNQAVRTQQQQQQPPPAETRPPVAAAARRDPLVAGMVASQPFSSTKVEQEYSLQRPTTAGSSTRGAGTSSLALEETSTAAIARLVRESEQLYGNVQLEQGVDRSERRLVNSLASSTTRSRPATAGPGGPQRQQQQTAAVSSTSLRVSPSRRSPPRDQPPVEITDPELEMEKLEQHIWATLRDDSGENIFAPHNYDVEWYINDPSNIEAQREKIRERKKRDFELMRNLPQERRDFVMYHTSDPDGEQKRREQTMASQMEKFSRQVRGHRAIKAALIARYEHEKKTIEEAKAQGKSLYQRTRGAHSAASSRDLRALSSSSTTTTTTGGGPPPGSSSAQRRGSSPQELSRISNVPSAGTGTSSPTPSTPPAATPSLVTQPELPNAPCLEDYHSELWGTGTPSVQQNRHRLFTNSVRPSSSAAARAAQPVSTSTTTAGAGSVSWASSSTAKKDSTRATTGKSGGSERTTPGTGSSHRQRAKGQSFHDYVTGLETKTKGKGIPPAQPQPGYKVSKSLQEKLASGDAMSWVTTAVV